MRIGIKTFGILGVISLLVLVFSCSSSRTLNSKVKPVPAANGWVGWDGDILGNDANTGTLSFKRWTVEWNGCAESYPDKIVNNCWAQTAGGYSQALYDVLGRADK